MTDWSANQYLKYRNERTQPAIDLVNRICMESPKKIIDIGCGPGNSTEVLARRFKGAYIAGVDNSETMIAKAKENYPHLDFSLCDVGGDLTGLDKDFDIVFSNACIQWVPDHRLLLKNLLGLLGKAGVLAIQIPFNFDEPIQQIIDEIRVSEEWTDYFPWNRPYHTLNPSEYYDIFSEIATGFEVWKVTYYHVLKSHEDILEWYQGTGLRPYLSALPEEKKPLFEQDVLNGIIQSYPQQKNCDVLFRFPRLFLMAHPI